MTLVMMKLVQMKSWKLTKSQLKRMKLDGKIVKQDVDEEMSNGDDSFTDDSDGSEMSEDESSDEETSSDADLSGDSEAESEESEEEQTPTQKKPEVVGKKRAIEAVTPSGKKAKVEPSSQKIGDKKGHVSTPHPTKQASKTCF
ncbi:histone deacetylase HDT3-like [Panicum virgatum]|uniref:histone deacetylase HDT3-like n=1 Tax=Panicum virgatum TaxID=38727 RepID=UPI0019D5F8E7|nr:histone deacetylase HDT3-like [Panicum virgatum]